jgi:heptosyltransferase-2
VVCATCEYYAPVQERIAIVKLGAMGDVLRTTALLADIHAAHSGAHITWLTHPASVPLLRNIGEIGRVVDVTETPALLSALDFDTVYSLDNADEGVAVASVLRSGVKRGFQAGPSGHCEGVYEGGDDTLFELGLWDDLKRKNTQSYLALLAATAGLTYSGGRPRLHISAADVEEAARGYASLPRPCIGINTDAGTRWLRKQWNLPYVELAVEAFVEKGYGVVLFGGESLESFNEALANRFSGSVLSPKTAKNVHALFAGISQVDVLLSGDTLAMHAAWAVGTPVVALFGPTSAPEIDLGEHDVKLFATGLDCLGCYLHTCSVDPHCMDRLTPEQVVSAVDARLAASQPGIAAR